MANVVRGFRRLGWVLTVPITILIILALFEDTKEFALSGYEAERDYNGFIPDDSTAMEFTGNTYPKMHGYAYFSNSVPMDVRQSIISDFTQPNPVWVHQDSSEKLKDRGWEVVRDGTPTPEAWLFTVHRSANKIKLAKLFVAAVIFPTLIIQGVISVGAWVIRGFGSR